jgi:hypothetical protein
MTLAGFNDDIITLPQQPINDKIKCYDSENKIIEIEVIENRDE